MHGVGTLWSFEMSPSRTFPLTAGALLLSGAIYRHTAVRGDTAPDLHPLVRRVLLELPVAQRERYAGWCAEAVLLSDRLYAAEHAQPGSLSSAAARAELWGGVVSVVWVREEGDPVHSRAYSPCRSCAALLDWFGVEAADAPAGPAAAAPPDPRLSTPTSPDSSELARRWALALASYASPDGGRHHIGPAAIDAFTRHGAISATPSEPGEQVAPSGFTIDPMLAIHTVRTLADFGGALGVRLTPLGVERDGAGLLAIDERSRVFVLDPTAEWWLGDTVDQAQATLLHGRAPARVREDGTWT